MTGTIAGKPHQPTTIGLDPVRAVIAAGAQGYSWSGVHAHLGQIP